MISAIENLRKNGFEVIVAESKEWATIYTKSMIKKGMSVAVGGSSSVAATGFLDYLSSLKDIALYNQYESDIDGFESEYCARMSLISDLFITGTNALTRDGKIVNFDFLGSKIAALNYGPKKVVIFAGVNKIVDDEEAAKKRINEIVIPKVIESYNEKALSYGKKVDLTKSEMSRKYSVIKGDEKGRITIVLIDEELGF